MKAEEISRGFYRSVNCDCKAVILVQNCGVVKLLKGSTVVFNRIDPDTEPGVADIADNLKNEMIMYGSLWTNTPYVMDVTDDHKFDNILDATRMVVGLDDVDPGHYWEPIFL